MTAAAARIPATRRTAARLLIQGRRIITANTGRIQAEELTRQWRRRAARHWRQDYGADWIAPPIEITAWLLHGGKRIDPGNLYPTLKAAIDGLRDAGAIGEDTDDWIAGYHLLPSTYAPSDSKAIAIVLNTTGPAEPPPGHNPNTYYQ